MTFSMTFKITNRKARKLWLQGHGLSRAPTGELDVLQIIKDLGFVQLDSIRNVTRAHHHILWSRNQNYREPMLWKCLAEDRTVFEHFTHDASIIPMDTYPIWDKQFRRMAERLGKSNYYKNLPDQKSRDILKARIKDEGPLSTRAFSSKVPDADYKNGENKMWARPPHKTALDYMWYIGELSTSHRANFQKFYDLTERIVPHDTSTQKHTHQQQIDWLCRAALKRLGIASLRDIQKFWDACTYAEVKNWAESNTDKLIPVSVQAANGAWHDMMAPPDIEQRMTATKTPTSRLRILNPFDPAIRNRDRLLRLFGFAYKIEIFVPAAKRKWGYYVYPLLEGSKFIGRIELKADRKTGTLTVVNLWAETNIKWTDNRTNKLSAELGRLARMITVRTIVWNCPQPPK